uniref:Phenolphthiocerol/phthiocerol polyketide synthase subunit E n=1 Tax=uncultured bacterium 14-4D TaxID=1497525 RepID=A0A059U100_9BACT|nr:PKS/NRPS [uncultured bacterium 14-4D]
MKQDDSVPEAMTATERHQLLVGWNDTARDFPRDSNIPSVFEAQVARDADAVAVVFGEQSVTYGELNSRANALAHHLQGLGVGPDVMVGLCVERGIEMVLAVLGVLKAGGTYVPLDPSYPSSRLAYMLDDTDAPVLLTLSGMRDGLPEHAGQVVCLDEIDWEQSSHDNPRVEASADSLAYVMYTSGSTGEPKGVMVPQRAVLRLVLGANYVQLESSDVVAQVSSFSFDAATFEVWGSLLNGARLVIIDKEVAISPHEFAEELVRQRITALFLTTALFNVLSKEVPTAFQNLRCLLFGGEAVDPPSVRRILDGAPPKRLLHVYGPTETTTFATFHEVTDVPPDAVTIPIGRPISNTTTYVLDAAHDPVPVGVVGDLFIGGDGVARGYLNQPALTEKKFIRDPFSDDEQQRIYATGDLVRYWTEGSIEFVGRTDQQIKLRGFRIELGEVENALSQLEAVATAAVLLCEDVRGEKTLVAYVSGTEPTSPRPDALRRALEKSLPSYMIPTLFVVLDELPLNRNGKIDRKALENIDLPTAQHIAESVAPESETERHIAGIWQELLSLDSVGIHDNFFYLGGHSLIATQVQTRIQGAFGIRVPMRRLFAAPTISELARSVDALKTRGTTKTADRSVVPVEQNGDPLLSSTQERIWFLESLNPDNRAYNFQTILDIKGRLNVNALQRSLNQIVSRHEIFRTSFPVKDGRPVQRIHPFEPVELPIEKLDEIPRDERPSEARRRIDKELKHAFQLDRLPLIRWKLYRIHDEEHLLLHQEHHLVHDGWSYGIFLAELSALYDAYDAGETPELAPPPIQYRDFSTWQRDRFDRGEYQNQLDYWVHQLEDAPPPLVLPSDRPRPQVQTSHGAQIRSDLDESFYSRLTAACRKEGVTTYMWLFALFQTFLFRYSGVTDICVGSGFASRGRPELEKLLGMVINTVVIRGDFSGAPTFREELQRFRQTIVEATDNQDVPFDKVVQAFNPERTAGQSILFNTFFDAYSLPFPSLSRDGLEITREDGVNNGYVKFDLVALVIPRGSGARANVTDPQHSLDSATLMWDYNSQLFDHATAERMLRHFRNLLDSSLADPGCRVSDLAMLDDDERHQLLVEWNDTAREFPRDLSIPSLFEFQVARDPDAVAVVFGEQSVTYGELNSRANALAHHLQDLGVGPEVMVGLCLERSVEMVVAVLGILKAGGAYVPLDPSYPRARLGFMLEDTAGPVLLTESSLRDRLPEYSGQVLCVDEFESQESSHAETNPPVEVGAENLAYVIYTSGSTGKPKGTCIEHRSVVRLVKSTNYVELGPDEVFLQFASISFDASTFELWGSLLNGAKLVVYPPGLLSLENLGDAIREHEVSVLWLTATLFHHMVDEQLESLRGVRQLLAGGETLSAPHVRRMLEVLEDGHRLINGYGPTENTTFTACHVMTRSSRVEGSVPIGRPISNTQVYILDAGMNPVPIGVAEELFIGGDGLAREYLHQPTLTDEKFVVNPFGEGRLYRTGDLARYVADGTIEFLGRVDNQVKVRGFRIELGEIETALLRHRDVRNAVVLCREDTPGDKRLAAYIVGADLQHPPAAKDLRCFVQDELPAYMVPSAFVPLEALPVTPAGKVDRKSLPAPERDRAGLDTRYVSPRSELEEQVADVWRVVLGTSEVGVRDNFFELGGHSLLITQVKWKLETKLERDVPMVALFQYPTIESLARHLEGGAHGSEFVEAARARARQRGEANPESDAIAIIGIAVRFPKADDVEAFWENIANGVESVHFFTEEELKASGVDDATLDDPSYVPAAAMLEDVELFDASFFGCSAREAELIDPQHRLFLECAWEALERAAYDPERYGGLIGVYAGSSASAYVDNLRSHPELVALAGALQLTVGNRVDFLPTRVSYKLNLRGPSVAVQTACSTSLVAVHQACRSLIDHECDIALAGGAKVNVPRAFGYTYVEEGILSPDGHCRSFDATARGTVGGEGIGVVVLKRLDEAVHDGDVIHAVIRGTAINNDGSHKVAYTAPSTEAQAEVIAMAQAAAGVQPDSIGYIEAHGTGTNLGDPIEVAALNMVFGSESSAKRQCALGTVKSNIGHLDTAAGVAGLVNAVQALKHRQLPPSLHFSEPNPEIDFDAGPLYVNTVVQQWQVSNGMPRRAGVSSFGMGGTNAHAVVEEAPAVAASDAASRSEQLLVVSAKTSSALERSSENLAEYLRQHPEESLSDVAFTLQMGRSEFEQRRAVMASNAAEAIAALGGELPKARWTGRAVAGEHEVAFLFPGQGAQYVNMGVELYRRERVFRETVDRCCELLEDELGADLRETLYPVEEVSEPTSARLKRTSWAQPALFVVEYALAAQWRSWGIEPSVCVGHSIGEYVAACVSGVLGLEDALRLVALRGRLMEAMPAGVMTAVPLAADEVETRLAAEPQLWLSAVNGPSLCVVSGSEDRVAAWEAQLAAEGIECRRLHTSHAFHSGLMDDAVAPFVAAVRDVEINEPQIPYLSNLTGKWITAADVRDPSYWGRHIRETVRFDECLARVLSKERCVLLEVGPGQVLGTLARQQPLWSSERVAVPSLRSPSEKTSDLSFLLGALGRLWTRGVRVEWEQVHGGERRRRVELPTYPFERETYWIDRAPDVVRGLQRRNDLADWFYIPSWQHSMLPAPRDDDGASPHEWLVFADASEFVRSVVARLKEAGRCVSVVEAGQEFARAGESFVINPRSREDYTRLLSDLAASEQAPSHIVHLWGATVERDRSEETAERCGVLGFFSLLYLAQALDDASITSSVRLDVVTVGVHGLREGEELHPEKATIVGPCRVIGREFPNVSCRHIDLAAHEVVNSASGSLELLLRELQSETDETMVAFRRGFRLVESFAPARLDVLEGEHPHRLRQKGTYWITGGLGGIGLELAKYLARSLGANLVLTARSGLPERTEWSDHVGRHGEDDLVSRRIRGVQALEESGAEVLVAGADVTDFERMRAVVSEATHRFGRIDGVIHSAGVWEGPMECVLKDRDQAAAVLAPKVTGARVLERLFGEAELDFLVLCSSIASVIPEGGRVDYCAANAYLDAFARDFGARTGTFTVSIGWNGWREVGMGVEFARRQGRDVRLQGSSNEEGVELFRRVLDRSTEPHVLISERELSAVLARPEAMSRRGEERARSGTEEASRAIGGHARPNLPTEFVAARTETERFLAELWQSLLGLEQVGIHDDFMELGGHSLLATQLTARVRSELSAELSLKDVFAGPTVAELASRIDQQSADSSQQRITALTDRIQQMSPAERRNLLKEARRTEDLNE